MINAQRLPTLDGVWELGPYLYKNQSDYGECVLQVPQSKSKLRQVGWHFVKPQKLTLEGCCAGKKSKTFN